MKRFTQMLLLFVLSAATVKEMVSGEHLTTLMSLRLMLSGNSMV